MASTNNDASSLATAGKATSTPKDRADVTRVATIVGVGALGIAVGLQLVMPPLLLSNWRDAGYAFFVAVQGFTSYVSVADAGIQLYLSQRLTTLRARGETSVAGAVTRGGLRAFALLASAGAAIVWAAFVATGHRVWSDLARDCGASPSVALAAAAMQVAAGAASLALGGWSTAVDCGHGRYLRVQVFGALRNVIVMMGIALLAASGLNPTSSMLIIGVAQISFELTRFTLTYHAERRVTDAAATAMPTLDILREARGSVLLSFSTTTQNGLQPYVTAELSSSAVSVAVPGRTLANGARTVSSAIASVVWVPVAARFAELDDPSARYRFWARNAPIMSIVQLAGILALLTLAPWVVPHWLPHKSAAILGLLPFYCVEQGAFAASIPTVILAQALGRFGLLGVVTLASATVSITATLTLVPRYGAVGFAFANAAAAALILVPGLLIWEWRYWKGAGVRPGSTLIRRGLTVVVTTAIAIVYSRARGLGIALLFLLLLYSAWIAYTGRRPMAEPKAA